MTPTHFDAVAPTGPDAALKPDAQRLYATALGRILKHVSEHASTTISELTDVSAVSRPTVQRALAELEELGLVTEAAHRPTGFGRPARAWDPLIGPYAVMALDIRPAETLMRVCSLTGPVLVDRLFEHSELRTQWAASSGDTTDASGEPTLATLILRHVRTLLAELGIAPDAVLECVIGVSGIVGSDGAVLLSVYVPELTGVALAELARTVVGLSSVLVENDMNLRAVAEMRTGVARGTSSFLYLTNHDFHRPAVVLGGQLWHGRHRTVGEGDVLSRTGVIVPELTHEGRTVEYFETAALIEDGTLGPEWIEVLNAQLAAVMAVLCYPLDPDVVIVHGGPLTTGPDALCDLADRFTRFAPSLGAPRVIAGSRGTDLTVNGALAVALRDALTRVLRIPEPPLPALHSPQELTK